MIHDYVKKPCSTWLFHEYDRMKTTDAWKLTKPITTDLAKFVDNPEWHVEYHHSGPESPGSRQWPSTRHATLGSLAQKRWPWIGMPAAVPLWACTRRCVRPTITTNRYLSPMTVTIGLIQRTTRTESTRSNTRFSYCAESNEIRIEKWRLAVLHEKDARKPLYSSSITHYRKTR